jgi:hypothetical protein
MQRLLLLTILVLASTSAFAYQLLHVGKVDSRHWNDVWNNFSDYSLNIYAGGDPDGTERAIVIIIENAFGDDYRKNFKVKKCSERQIKKNKCASNGYTINEDFRNLVYILDKSIKWSKIARENKVESVSKSIVDDRGRTFYSPFRGGDVRFYASNSGNQTDLILPVYFKLSEATDRYYDLEAQENFYRLLTEEVTKTIDKSKGESTKVDELFK